MDETTEPEAHHSNCKSGRYKDKHLKTEWYHQREAHCYESKDEKDVACILRLSSGDIAL